MKKKPLQLERRFVSVLAATMIVVGLHAAAFADEVEPTISSSTTTYTNQFYIALGAGISRVYPEDECPCIAVGEPLSGGVSLAIGYDFARWLSAEAYIADLGSSSIDFFDQDVGDVDYQVFGASLLATFYRSDSGFGFNNNSAAGRKGLSLYGRVGVGGLETTTDLDFRRDHPQHVAFGLGMEYGMNRGFSVRGELISFDTDAQLLQVSLVKRFGGKRRSGSVQNVAAPVIAAPDETPKSAVVVAPGADLPKTYFAFDQHELTPEANVTVARIASILKEIEGTIQIDGHADHTGTKDYNYDLSVRRAQSVRKGLIASGIPARRLRISGFGETRPAVSNDTEAGRAQNRRVEITLRAQ